jgi:CBS-domain-containing membrane protein
MDLGFDHKFRKNAARYVIQCAVAGIMAMVFLIFLGVLQHIGVVAALGATTFMIFTMPHRVSSGPRYVVGGYVMGTLSGVLCNLLFLGPRPLLPMPGLFVIGAISVGVASLLMVSTNTEHPPACGLALGLVLQQWDYRAIFYVLGGVSFLSLARYLLRKWLIDLL